MTNPFNMARWWLTIQLRRLKPDEIDKIAAEVGMNAAALYSFEDMPPSDVHLETCERIANAVIQHMAGRKDAGLICPGCLRRVPSPIPKNCFYCGLPFFPSGPPQVHFGERSD